MAEIVDAVAVAPMPAGYDYHDVIGFDGGHGVFKVGDRDEFPLLLRDRQHNAGAEEALERNLTDAGCALDEMERRIHMRATVHDHANARGHYPVLGVRACAVELDVVEPGQGRHVMAPFVAEF